MHELLDQARSGGAEQTAVVDASGAYTYAELVRAAGGCAAWLTDCEVLPGDRVLYAGPSDHRCLAFLYGTLSVGAVFVPVDQQLSVRELTPLIADCRARVVISSAAVVAVTGQRLVVALDTAWAAVTRAAGTNSPRGRADTDGCPWADDLALLLYDGGRRGVKCPHRQLVAAVDAIQTCLQYRPDDVVLGHPQLSSGDGLHQALLCASAGATLLLGRGHDCGSRSALQRHQVSVVTLVPGMASDLIHADRTGPRPDVRMFTNAGPRLDSALITALLQRFPGAAYASTFGTTECRLITIQQPADRPPHPDLVGRPVPGATVRILDRGHRPLDPYAVGEIAVRGPTVTAGYWNVQADQQRRYVEQTDGTLELRTGELGYLDRRGQLYLADHVDSGHAGVAVRTLTGALPLSRQAA